MAGFCPDVSTKRQKATNLPDRVSGLWPDVAGSWPDWASSRVQKQLRGCGNRYLGWVYDNFDYFDDCRDFSWSKTPKLTILGVERFIHKMPMKPKTAKSPDSPDRCQGVGRHGGQCWNERAENSPYCEICANALKQDSEGVKKQWLVEQFEKRVKLHCQAGEEIQLLRENLGQINALIAARLALVVDPGSLIANSGALAQLLQTADKITTSLVKLEQSADELLGKEALIKWGQKVAIAVRDRIEGKFDGWEDTVIELSDDIARIIAEASNKEQTDE